MLWVGILYKVSFELVDDAFKDNRTALKHKTSHYKTYHCTSYLSTTLIFKNRIHRSVWNWKNVILLIKRQSQALPKESPYPIQCLSSLILIIILYAGLFEDEDLFHLAMSRIGNNKIHRALYNALRERVPEVRGYVGEFQGVFTSYFYCYCT